MDIDKEMLKGYIDSIILSVLEKERMYGYELSKKIRALSNESFEIKEGTLYVVLKRLENKGLVTTEWGDEINIGARRKYYNITSAGTQYLKAQKLKWKHFKNILEIFFEDM